ncbi:hypothetical protein PoB_006515500 [Plakobranchus ocellatus]|uniref:Uncharacterized protein n=1 Tax=Plakobranchus ocellatus TaxID=259542 RepID=A0AAV4D3C9_9GAST|nr:hypothetical protein PoB_006515500 [Plakobranchus ocellatus]
MLASDPWLALGAGKICRATATGSWYLPVPDTLWLQVWTSQIQILPPPPGPRPCQRPSMRGEFNLCRRGACYDSSRVLPSGHVPGAVNLPVVPGPCWGLTQCEILSKPRPADLSGFCLHPIPAVRYLRLILSQ